MSFKDQAKFTGTLLLSGVGVGLLASMVWGPSLVSWWWTPPGDRGSLGNLCGDQVRDSAAALVNLQVGTGLALGVVVAIVGQIIRHKRAANATLGAPAAPPATPPTAPTSP